MIEQLKNSWNILILFLPITDIYKWGVGDLI